MNKNICLMLLLLQLCGLFTIEGNDVESLYETAVETKNKMFVANWPFKFKSVDQLYDLNFSQVDPYSQEEIERHYNRMLHAHFFGKEFSKEMVLRVRDFCEYVPSIITYIEGLSQKYHANISVQHISIYGSFLYNAVDPDDVDLLIVVDSPTPIFDHIEIPAADIVGEKEAATLPKISFQILDYNTYISAQRSKKEITRAQNIAQQQLAVAGSWYLTIFGFDLRYDELAKLKPRTKLNYLNKAFSTHRAAGSRLYKEVYRTIPMETERIRLRKVVSRLMITDFLLASLDASVEASPEIYHTFYDEIRDAEDYEQQKWIDLENKIENLYFQKLRELLLLANKYSKIDQVEATDK